MSDKCQKMARNLNLRKWNKKVPKMGKKIQIREKWRKKPIKLTHKIGSFLKRAEKLNKKIQNVKNDKKLRKNGIYQKKNKIPKKC